MCGLDQQSLVIFAPQDYHLGMALAFIPCHSPYFLLPNLTETPFPLPFSTAGGMSWFLGRSGCLAWVSMKISSKKRRLQCRMNNLCHHPCHVGNLVMTDLAHWPGFGSYCTRARSTILVISCLKRYIVWKLIGIVFANIYLDCLSVLCGK